MAPFNYRLGIISDPHIALPETIVHRSRFHLVEVSLAAFEQAIAHLCDLGIDALLLPGDLTQDGEHLNHQWLQARLKTLPFPAFVIPGNHDVIYPSATETVLGLAEFPTTYADFGYHGSARDNEAGSNPAGNNDVGDTALPPWYHQELTPGLHLVGLNSNQFEADGTQQGYLDDRQLAWIERTLQQLQDVFVIVMAHHNSVEHLPDQLTHPMGRRYMLDNAPQVRQVLRQGGVQLVLTGHLHVQDVAEQDGVWEIVTGSLVSYPHPYRLVELSQDAAGRVTAQVQSFRVNQVPGYADLAAYSHQQLSERSFPFMKRLIQSPPLNLPDAPANDLARQLRHFWAEIAEGDRTFDFHEQPEPIRQWLERFSATEPKRDNHTQLCFQSSP
ncbi:MAG: metallophosphoesterase [Cyanobacteria bacterium P01_G01_bin.54]